MVSINRNCEKEEKGGALLLKKFQINLENIVTDY
jgi:hypothetical protein